MSGVHNFRADLARSHRAAQSPLWNDIYGLAFPDFHSQVIEKDLALQRQGVDRLITLTSGRVVKVEEKQRYEEWPDILLEMWSDKEHRKKGWAAKPSVSDYLLYIFNPSHRCYLYPFDELLRVTRVNAEDWLGAYGWKKSPNIGYETWSIPVPFHVLKNSIPTMRQFTF